MITQSERDSEIHSQIIHFFYFYEALNAGLLNIHFHPTLLFIGLLETVQSQLNSSNSVQPCSVTNPFGGNLKKSIFCV